MNIWFVAALGVIFVATSFMALRDGQDDRPRAINVVGIAIGTVAMITLALVGCGWNYVGISTSIWCLAPVLIFLSHQRDRRRNRRAAPKSDTSA